MIKILSKCKLRIKIQKTFTFTVVLQIILDTIYYNNIYFSDEVAKFLVGAGIDKDIVSLPQRVLSSPLGPLLKSVYLSP